MAAADSAAARSSKRDQMEKAGYLSSYLARNNQLTSVSFDDIAGLQSAKSLAVRMRNPLSRAYINNFFFLHPAGHLTKVLSTTRV